MRFLFVGPALCYADSKNQHGLSFGFRLTAGTLTVRLTVPPPGPAEDLHLQMSAPYRAHNEKGQPLGLPLILNFWAIAGSNH